MKQFMYILLCSVALGACKKEENTVKASDNIDTTNDIDIDFSFDYQKGKDTRSLLKCDSYTQIQKDSLNQLFAESINKAGNKRAKTVTAATFLVSMNYAIPYGFEWRIADDPSYEFVGRYTKKGLHLTRLTDSNGTVHQPWGCLVNTHPRYPHQTVKNLGDTYENGLNCSSFIGWCLFNADAVTDLNLLERTYADDYRTFPLSTEINLKEGVESIRPGDLLWFKGHIAIVIGVKNDIVIYASAEGGSVHPGKGISWLTFNKKTTNFDTFAYKSLIQMNKVYGD